MSAGRTSDRRSRISAALEVARLCARASSALIAESHAFLLSDSERIARNVPFHNRGYYLRWLGKTVQERAEVIPSLEEDFARVFQPGGNVGRPIVGSFHSAAWKTGVGVWSLIVVGRTGASANVESLVAKEWPGAAERLRSLAPFDSDPFVAELEDESARLLSTAFD